MEHNQHDERSDETEATKMVSQIGLLWARRSKFNVDNDELTFDPSQRPVSFLNENQNCQEEWKPNFMNKNAHKPGYENWNKIPTYGYKPSGGRKEIYDETPAMPNMTNGKHWTEFGLPLLAVKRTGARYHLDKANREWKVEWVEDGELRTKKFSCKRWGKAKAHASAVEYYILVTRGVQLDTRKPFFSQIRKYIDQVKGPNALGCMKKLFESRSEQPANGNAFFHNTWDASDTKKKSQSAADDSESLQMAYVLGNLSVDALCSSMHACNIEE